MRNLKKRITLTSLAVLGSASFLLGVATSMQAEVKADTAALEAEFTNNGAFSISTYNGVPYDFVDGDSDSLPAGYDGAVLRVSSGGGTGFVTLDFSAMQIQASKVGSIVVRAYSPDYKNSAQDEFRTLSNAGALRQYGVGAYDMSTWCDIPLTSTSIADMTDANGYLSSITLGLRDKETISTYFYIDSITIETVETETAVFNGPWGNPDAYNTTNQVLLQYASTTAWDYANKGNLISKITFKNSKTGATYAAADSNVVGWEGQRWIVLRNLPNVDVIEIAAGGTFGGAIEIPALTLYCVNGRWVTTAPQAPTANYSAIAGGWNNSIVEGKGQTILTFDVNPLGNGNDATNLAATMNATSMMVKYNGKSFFELYSDTTNANHLSYIISYAHGNGYFYFSVPEADLVEGATFEIENGTPFMNNYLSGVKFTFTNGQWQEAVNYEPNYVKIGTFNHYDNETLWGLSLVYNTTGFAAAGVQVMAAGYTGITLNGEPCHPAFFGGEQLLFWFAKEKCEPGYNGYKYPTLVIAEGATVTNDNGETFTLGGVKLYLVNGAWTTEYQGLPLTSFVEVETAYGWNNTIASGMAHTLLEFSNTLGAASDATNQAAATSFDVANKIKLNGKSVNAWYLEDGQTAVDYQHGAMYLQIKIPESYLQLSSEEYPYLTLTIEEGTEFFNYGLPAVELYCVNGYWVTQKPATQATTNYTGIASGWNNRLSNGVSDTILKFDVNPLGDVADYANLASTANATALMVKYNGKTFFELHKDTTNANHSKYAITYAHGNAFFHFAIPEADLVEGATLEIENGTPFMNNYLAGAKFTFTNGQWQEVLDINLNPDFVKIGTINNMVNDGLQAYGLSLVYNTNGFTSPDEQIMPESSTGFTLNGEDINPALWGGEQLLFWLSMAKCEPNTNGYSHATLEIAEGAKIVNKNGKEFTFKALTLYLVDGAWTTEQPADYTVTVIDTTNYNPEFEKIGTFNHYDNDAHWGLSVVFNTTGFAADNVQVMANSSLGFTINGETQSVALFGGNQLLFWIKKAYCEPNYNGYSHATLEIAEGATVINEKEKQFTFTATTFYLVDGAWTTEKPADYVKLQPTTFVGIDESSTKNSVVLTFTDDVTWNTNVGNVADYVLLDGVTTLALDGGSVVANSENKTVTITVNGDYSKLEIAFGGNIASVIIPQISVYSTEDGWSLTPQKFNTLSGIGVYGNNNIPVAGVYYHTVLQYKEFFVLGNSTANDATNMAASEAFEVATKVKLNGKSFYELYQEDYHFYIGYLSGGAYFTFQIPASYLDGEPENGYEYHTIEIEEGTVFMDWKLPALTMISYDKVWINADGFKPEPLEYTGVAGGWNCMQSGLNIDTILQFGNYELNPDDNSYIGDYLGEDNGTISHADETNLAAIATEQIATKMTINGVPVKDISGVTVSYAHGYNFLYISLPAYELTPNDNYKCVVLHIEANTVFKKSVLSEVTLYLVDGQWQTEAPTTIADDTDGTYLTANDLFGVDSSYFADGVYRLMGDSDKAEIVSPAKATESGVIYNLLYKSSSSYFDYSLYTGVTDTFGGVRVAIFRNPDESMQGFNVYANDTWLGSKQSAFVAGEWYAIRIAIAVQDATLSISVAVDGVEVIYAETEYDGAIGEEIKLKKTFGELTFADFRKGDIKKPTIHWQGKTVYKFSAGETQPEDAKFLQVLSVTDNYDKANFAAEDINVIWQDGAVKDGVLQSGEWTLTFAASDKAGNIAYYTVIALVTNPNEITLALQANGETSYQIHTKGELLTKPADPTKEGDEAVNYIFDGWYLGDKKWDFANDYAFEDITLVAVFTVEYKEYTVTVVSDGLESAYTYTFQLRYGSTLDVSILACDGYTYKLVKDGEEIDEVFVDGELQITVVYTAKTITPGPDDSSSGDSSSDSSNSGDSSSDDTSSSESSSTSSSKKSGCSGSVGGVFIGLALALASAVVLVRKGGKENE